MNLLLVNGKSASTWPTASPPDKYADNYTLFLFEDSRAYLPIDKLQNPYHTQLGGIDVDRLRRRRIFVSRGNYYSKVTRGARMRQQQTWMVTVAACSSADRRSSKGRHMSNKPSKLRSFLPHVNLGSFKNQPLCREDSMLSAHFRANMCGMVVVLPGHGMIHSTDATHDA